MQLLQDWRQAPILEQKTALFGFGSGQDLDDASKVVAVADQGGLGLPDRDYYLKDDANQSNWEEQRSFHPKNARS